MTGFPLKIVTPDGLVFDGIAEMLLVRTISGDLGIMARHMDCVVPLGMGEATLVADGKRQYAACMGGMVTVLNGAVTLVPTTFEWADDIDMARAQVSEKKAQAILGNRSATETEVKLAKARLQRALVRQNVRK